MRAALLALAAAVLAAPARAEVVPALGDVGAVLRQARERSASMPAPPVKPDNPWARVRTPTKSKAESIGFYDRGCLRGARALPLSGTGYEVMRPSRARFYGHPRLVAFLTGFGARAASVGTALIGDLGMARGGPMPSGHASHQMGLDVDVWYRILPPGGGVSDSERETLDTPQMVTPEFEGLNESWDPRVLELLALAASDPAVERIFVNPSVKKEACRVKAGAPWLSKLRPWWEHDDHFHVRLKCAPGDASCRHQGAPPDGDGCGAELAGWFTPESKAEARRKRAEPASGALPALPALCKAVLNEP